MNINQAEQESDTYDESKDKVANIKVFFAGLTFVLIPTLIYFLTP